MKVMKRISAWFMALAVLLSMSGVTAFAAPKEAEKPKAKDTVSITVLDIQPGSTVTAYQIIKGDYDAEGNLTGYSPAVPGTIKDLKNPTEKEIKKISYNIPRNIGKYESIKMNPTEKNDSSYTAEVPAGTYLIRIGSKTIDRIYNSILVSAYYDKDGVLVAGNVSANDSGQLAGGRVYAKSSAVTVEKTIDHSKDKVLSGNEKGTDAAIGDDVTFHINTVIPDYGPAFNYASFVIKDELSVGLLFNNDFVIKADGQELNKDMYTLLTKKVENKDTMAIVFYSDYVMSHPNAKIEVTYTAKVTKDAQIGFDANTNTASLLFSHRPCGKMEEIKKYNYVYTFAIDGELLKVGSEETSKEMLKGAEFKLTNQDTEKVYTTVTDEQGKLVFNGLDAGRYTLEETKAPDGYTLDKTKRNVEIKASYYENGRLKEYTVLVDQKVIATYKGTDSEKVSVTKQGNPYHVPNTKLIELPSTGGTGTYVFTIGGISLMIVAAALFLVSRKKEQKQ